MIKKDNLAYQSHVHETKCNQAIFDNTQSIIHDYFQKQFQSLFENIDDAFFDQADKAANNNEQASFFDAMRIIRKERQSIENNYYKATLDRYREFWLPKNKSNQTKQQNQSIFQLSLVTDDALEQNIAINDMIKKGETHHHDFSDFFEYRFAYFQNQHRLDSEKNPVCISSICKNFQQIIDPIDINIEAKLVIYKLFERFIVNQLAEMYESLSQKLSEYDSGENINHQPIQQNIKKDQTQTLSTNKTSVQKNENNNVVMHPSVTKQPLDHFSDINMKQYVPVNVIHEYFTRSHSQTVQDLSNLQNQSLHQLNTTTNNQTQNTNTSIPELSSNDHHEVVESSVINMVSMVFEFFIDDENIDNRLRILLSQLQIPMIKVALLDKTFFEKTDHPARKLLNAMVKVCSSNHASNAKQLFNEIERIVKLILTDFDQDIAIFSQLLNEFVIFSNNFTHKHEPNNKVSVPHSPDTPEIEKIKSLLKTRLEKHSIPAPAKYLIMDGWKKILIKINEDSGHQCSAWKNAMTTINDLIMSLQPKKTTKEKKQLLESLPNLLKKIRQQFNSISYNPKKLSRLLKTLQLYHIRIILNDQDEKEIFNVLSTLYPDDYTKNSNSDIPTLYDKVDFPASLKSAYEFSDVSKAEVHTPNQPIIDENTEIAERMKIGSWLEVILDNDQTLHVKLFWVNQNKDRFIFVNRKGVKVLELSIDTFSEMIRTTQAVPLQNIPFIDRAVSFMAKTFSKSTAMDAKYLDHRV